MLEAPRPRPLLGLPGDVWGRVAALGGLGIEEEGWGWAGNGGQQSGAGGYWAVPAGRSASLHPATGLGTAWDFTALVPRR